MPTSTSARSRLHVGRHTLAAIGLFGAQSLIWTFPLVLHMSTHLPGRGYGDNVAFLWNFWWMRTALDKGIDVFHTSFLFAPVGAGLTLHTHTALSAFIGATALGSFSVITAQNVMILGALFLNGFCAYLLACEVTRDRGAALVAGIVFGGSPYISAHLNGHFNLIAAWVIPLFALAVLRVVQGGWRWGAMAGLVFATTMYVDYYYVVYELAIAGCVCALEARRWSVTVPATRTDGGRLAVLVWWALIVDVAAIIAIAAVGEFSFRLGTARVRVGLFNALQIFWGLAGLALWLRWRPRVRAPGRANWPVAHVVTGTLLGLGVLVIVAAPLLWNAVGLLARSST